ncbi:MAG: prepilin-type N-terminal cleavage/methylation domain-containing protein [Kiritimatiellae bacterium]|nr:prepilin-type N-terminal cleavage/methylation domain-containing protein [Kiritimatiellia bacterium]
MRLVWHGLKVGNAGFTLVEVIVVSAILVILTMIAVPSYMKSRLETNRNACIENMAKIASAVEQAKTMGFSEPTYEQIFGVDGFIRAIPTCPSTRLPYTQFNPPRCPSEIEDHISPLTE